MPKWVPGKSISYVCVGDTLTLVASLTPTGRNMQKRIETEKNPKDFPDATKPSTVARPIPVDAPVITATFEDFRHTVTAFNEASRVT